MVGETEIVGAWQFLGKYLEVDVEIIPNDSADTDAPLVVKFTVTNSAPDRLDYPEILFEDIELTVLVPPDLHTEKVASLASGQSFKYERRCRHGDLLDMSYSVDGKISPKRFFQVQRTGIRIPTVNDLPPTSVYLEVLSQIGIHKWLNSTIKKMPIPGPETTLAKLKESKGNFTSAIVAIRGAQERIQDALRFVGDTHKQEVLEHKKVVVEYLSHTEKGCARLREMLSHPNADQLSTERDKIVAGLEGQASRVDEATNDLVK